MARLIYSERAFKDLERLTDFLYESDPVSALETIELISKRLQILASHPLAGRPVQDELREFVVTRGASGYIALYSYEDAFDAVLILTIRHQREVGYPD